MIFMKIPLFPCFRALLLVLVTAFCAWPSLAQNPPPPPPPLPLDYILRDLGPNSTYADVRAAVSNGTRASALRRTFPRVIPTQDFTGPWTSVTGREQMAIFSDDGCTITITPRGGRAITPISRWNQGQDLNRLGADGIPIALTKLEAFIPRAGVTYDITVQYSNRYHTGPNDLDGLTLFVYRQTAAPPAPVPYDAALSHDQLTPTSLRLFWQSRAGATNYRLYRDTQRAVRADNDHKIYTGRETSYIDNGLVANTTYYYKLFVQLRPNTTGDPFPNPGSYPVTTPNNTYRVTFTGSNRALAGHQQNDAHIVELTATMEKRNAQGNYEAAPQIEVGLLLANLNSRGDAPQLLRRESDNRETPLPATERLITSTDAQGQIFIRVLSGQALSTSTLVVVQVNTAVAPAPANWQNVSRRQLEFGTGESKRLFNDGTWQVGFSNDTGWHFERYPIPTNPPNTPADYVARTVFDGKDQILRGRIFLRFRRDTSRGGNQNYTGTTEASATVNGTDGQPLWLPVDKHLLRIRINSIDIPNDDATAPVASLTPRVVTFCNAQGDPVRDNGAAEGQWVATAANAPLPEYITVKVENGVATFYLKSGVQISQTTQINLSAQDITVIR